MAYVWLFIDINLIMMIGDAQESNKRKGSLNLKTTAEIWIDNIESSKMIFSYFLLIAFFGGKYS